MTRRTRHDPRDRAWPSTANRRRLLTQRSEEDARLWGHVLHEDEQLFQRGNYFLLAESLLVVAYSGLLAASEASTAVHGSASHLLLTARIMAVFGLLLTAGWLYVGHRHLKYCRYVQ